MTEATLLKLIRRDLNATGRCRLVRNNVGVDLERGIRYGLGNGSADLIGVLRDGHAFAIEVKSATGRLRPDQISWWRAATRWGVRGGVARSIPEAFDLLERAERGEAPRL